MCEQDILIVKIDLVIRDIVERVLIFQRIFLGPIENKNCVHEKIKKNILWFLLLGVIHISRDCISRGVVRNFLVGADLSRVGGCSTFFLNPF